MSNVVANGRSADLLFLHAQTPMHPGSGTALGVVDLPIQRERHTQWPIIAGSALKGILRDACREEAKEHYTDDPANKERTRRRQANEEHVDLLTAFGPGKPDESSEHAGALNVTDARLLAFPVRSLKGVFAWVTCPAVLQRFNRDLQLAGLSDVRDRIPNFNGADEDEVAACSAESPLLIRAEDKLILEEFEFSRTDDFASAARLAKCITHDLPTQQRLTSHFAVISDNVFGHFVRHATEIVARIGLDYERKTVKKGALFYQEFLPAESVFYAVILAHSSRRSGVDKSAGEVLAYLAKNVASGKVLQIGGDETTGKGFCTTNWLNGKGA